MKPLLFLALLLPLLAFAKEIPLCTDRVLTMAEARVALVGISPSLAGLPLGSTAYAQCNNEQVVDMLAVYWAWLFKQGIPFSRVTGRTGWSPRFNCKDFTDGFIFRARLRHHFEGESATHPAIFSVSYLKDHPAKSGPGAGMAEHCIALLLTNAGPVFVDPQSGRVELSPAERNSLYWVVD